MKADDLAIILAVSCELNPIPANRASMLALWDDKTASQQVGYKLRAARLLRAWDRKGIKTEWSDRCA